MRSPFSRPTPVVPRLKNKGWRQAAAHIVEELFPSTDPKYWNLLLDLREWLLSGEDWETTLNCFLHCRDVLEADHYLPFYRLRKLFCTSLKLEITDRRLDTPCLCLARALRNRHRSLSDIRRAVYREAYEQDLEVGTPDNIHVRLVERF